MPAALPYLRVLQRFPSLLLLLLSVCPQPLLFALEVQAYNVVVQQPLHLTLIQQFIPCRGKHDKRLDPH